MAEDKDSTPLSESIKHDDDKLPMDLISPYFKEAIVEVLREGAKKYSRWNWAFTGFKVSRLRAAIDRHLNEFDKRNDIDDEFGLTHLAHAACMLMFLIHQMERPDLYIHLDDRPDFNDMGIRYQPPVETDKGVIRESRIFDREEFLYHAPQD